VLHHCYRLQCALFDKGKVESGVGHAQKTPLKAQRFDSLEAAQTYLDHWEERWADTRIHGTTKRQVAAMFAEEKPSLRPLPLEPFRYYQYGERTVHLDGCVEVEAAYYSAPPGWITRIVQIQWDGLYVRLLDPRTGQRPREHLRQARGRRRIKDEDRSKRTPPGTVHLLERAARSGPNIGQFTKALYELQAEAAVRRIQGILSFTKKYGVARVDDACAAAVELQAYDYRFVRVYLERRFDREQNTVLIVTADDAAGAGRARDLLARIEGEVPVWIYEPDATAQSAIAWMKAGASHVVTQVEEIGWAIGRAVREMVSAPSAGTPLVGVSRAIRAVASHIALVANRHCNVLIEGETGTGKEVVAREIHRSGQRGRAPWVAVNCGAIPETLLEAELFGHAGGAFTGAVQARAGKFEAANHGTIFLDEIGDMPLAVQSKLLRVLQEREIERLGGNERIRLDVRVIAATNVNLAERVKRGLFRQDLFFRLNVFRIAIPPLRERPEDIALLANHFAARVCANEGMRPKTLDASTLDHLTTHAWPGNARELENAIETAVILSGERPSIYISDIRFGGAPARLSSAAQAGAVSLPAEGIDYQQAIETFEHHLLTQALSRTRGNKTAAADLLHLKRTTLSARMRVMETRMPRLVA
jgi:DNA-binding NtrC family response regulator